MSRGQTGFVPGTKWVCPRDKPRFAPYFTQWKPSLSLGQTQFVPGTFRGRRAAERVYVLKVYVPFSFPKEFEQVIFANCLGVFSWCLHVASYSCVLVVVVPKNVKIGVFLCGKFAL